MSVPPRVSAVRVDLDAIAANARALAAAVRPARLWAVVKADAYGHGAAESARAALGAGAQGLCVALAQEALALRQAGVAGPILVLGPLDEAEMAAMAPLQVAVTLPDAEAVARARRSAARTPVEARPLRAHLKVDTGMGRIGCPPEAAPALARSIADSAELALEGVFTHFASADEDLASVAAQLARFEAVRAAVTAALPPHATPLWHSANSAAALTVPASRLDVVRAGLALYGYPALAPGQRTDVGLRPALSVVSRVSFVKRVPAGFAVSYGSTYRTPGARVLATLPLGYADGLRRGLTGLEVLVGERRVPIVGRVTMDQVVVEGPADWPVAYGDPALVLDAGGRGPTAADWAARAGTIPYEILTGLSPRLPRLYEAAPADAAGEARSRSRSRSEA